MPIYSFTSQSVVTLYFSSWADLRCRARFFLEYLTPNQQQPRWNELNGFRLSIVPGYCLRGVIHKVPVVRHGNHVQFVLSVGIHTSLWLIVRRCIRCTPFTWDCIYLWINGILWIYGSLFTILYLCNYLGKNIWRTCTCIVIWCCRWHWLHAGSSYLSLIWVWWLLLDSLWYFLLQGFLFCYFYFLWSNFTYCSHIC